MCSDKYCTVKIVVLPFILIGFEDIEELSVILPVDDERRRPRRDAPAADQ